MLATLLASAALAVAPFPETIPVPAGSRPEGIATGRGRRFYVGSRARRLGRTAATARTGEGAILGRRASAGSAGVRAQARAAGSSTSRAGRPARHTSTTRAPALTSTSSS